ncbi:MAG: zinc metallopeptidase [Planctomycetota bacterium]
MSGTLLFFFYAFDPLYLLLMVPGMLVAAWAQAKVHGAYSKYARVATRSRITGGEVAKVLLRARGLTDVTVEPTRGFLTDHYDPRHRVLRLSEGNFHSSSIAAVGVAAHESGHALQHADHYAPLELRSAIVPAVQIGSSAAWLLLFLGMLFAASGSLFGRTLLLGGLGCFGLALAFALVTLPVEINASRRALQLLGNTGILQADETEGARQVLVAAAYTYLAGLIVAALQFLYFFLRVLPYLSGGRRND